MCHMQCGLSLKSFDRLLLLFLVISVVHDTTVSVPYFECISGVRTLWLLILIALTFCIIGMV